MLPGKRSFYSRDAAAVLGFMDEVASDGSCSDYEDYVDESDIDLDNQEVDCDCSELFEPPRPLDRTELTSSVSAVTGEPPNIKIYLNKIYISIIIIYFIYYISASSTNTPLPNKLQVQENFHYHYYYNCCFPIASTFSTIPTTATPTSSVLTTSTAFLQTSTLSTTHPTSTHNSPTSTAVSAVLQTSTLSTTHSTLNAPPTFNAVSDSHILSTTTNSISNSVPLPLNTLSTNTPNSSGSRIAIPRKINCKKKSIGNVIVYYCLSIIAYTFTAVPGVTVQMNGKEPIDFFHLFFTPEVKKLIHVETTRYAEQRISNSQTHLQQHKHARAHAWIKNPMKPEEVDPFLAIIILMGLVGFPTIR